MLYQMTNFKRTKFIAFVQNKSNTASVIGFGFERKKTLSEKKKKCWSPAFHTKLSEDYES